jgi:hypothetical protein
LAACRVHFYGSFEPEKLSPELPLPKEVVEHAVLGRHMEVVWDPEHMKGKTLHPSLSPRHILHKEARLGVPQGSACSSIIGAFCMSRLPWVPKVGVVMLNYVDDFLLLANSPSALAEAIDELTEAVGDLPGGKFKLQLVEKGSASHGFCFPRSRVADREGEADDLAECRKSRVVVSNTGQT